MMANAEQALPRAYDVIVYGASGFTGPPGAVRISRASALIFVAVISVPLIPAAELGPAASFDFGPRGFS